MGNWNISIQGTGCHHNKTNETDAQRMALKFVTELNAAGHSLCDARFTYGSTDDLLNIGPANPYYAEPGPHVVAPAPAPAQPVGWNPA